jgi:hypothetical protein
MEDCDCPCTCSAEQPRHDSNNKDCPINTPIHLINMDFPVKPCTCSAEQPKPKCTGDKTTCPKTQSCSICKKGNETEIREAWEKSDLAPSNALQPWGRNIADWWLEKVKHAYDEGYHANIKAMVEKVVKADEELIRILKAEAVEKYKAELKKAIGSCEVCSECDEAGCPSMRSGKVLISDMFALLDNKSPE